MVESREEKNIEDLEFIVEILVAFFSLEANAIDSRLMASTINGFTTGKELMNKERYSFLSPCLGMSSTGRKTRIEKSLRLFPPDN